ncbi:MAG: hypothetical protein U0V72_11645 [Cytophagales bacterium]
MKKLILTLLAIVALTACKKNIVEPVVQNTEVNRLPKKMIRRGGYNKSQNVKYYDFYYNNQNLLSHVVSYDSLDVNIKDTLSISYDDKNRVISKKNHKYFKMSGISTEGKSITSLGNQFKEIEYIYEGDIVTKKNIDGSCCAFDTLYNKNGFFVRKEEDVSEGLGQISIEYTENGTFEDLPIGIKKNNSIYLQADEMWSGNYIFLSKEIEFQIELAVALGLHIIVPKEDAMKMDNKYYYCASKSSAYTGCEIEEFEYQFDKYGRLISINNHANNISTCMDKYISTIFY